MLTLTLSAAKRKGKHLAAEILPLRFAQRQDDEGAVKLIRTG